MVETTCVYLVVSLRFILCKAAICGSLSRAPGTVRLRHGRRPNTHNLIEVDFGFSNGFPGSTDGEWYSIIHEHLMELCYGWRIGVVDDRVVGVADG